MDRKSCMRRKGTPAWMQVADGACLPRAGREQAVEEARSRPDLPAAGRRGSTLASPRISIAPFVAMQQERR